MLKREISYKDYDGHDRTETLWFNMNRFELTEFAADIPDSTFKRLSGAKDMQSIGLIANDMGIKSSIGFVKKRVLASYGVKSEDGRRFIKSPELREEFMQTIAFDTFMSELMTDDNAAANFVNSIIPADLADKVAEAQAGVGALPQK